MSEVLTPEQVAEIARKSEYAKRTATPQATAGAAGWPNVADVDALLDSHEALTARVAELEAEEKRLQRQWDMLNDMRIDEKNRVTERENQIAYWKKLMSRRTGTLIRRAERAEALLRRAAEALAKLHVGLGAAHEGFFDGKIVRYMHEDEHAAWSELVFDTFAEIRAVIQ